MILTIFYKMLIIIISYHSCIRRTCVTDYILELASREPEMVEAILIKIDEKCRADEIKICYDWIGEMKSEKLF